MSTQITPQNFSIPAGYSEILIFEIESDVIGSLAGMVIWWRVYEEEFGVPTSTMLRAPIIEKSTPVDIVSIDSPLSFVVQMYTDDTVGLLRNYYHEATILSESAQFIGGSFGIMTVTETMNRESGS